MNLKSLGSDNDTPSAFDYSSLDSDARLRVQEKTSRLKSLIQRSARDIIEVGQYLIEIKSELSHGNFDKWLEAEFSWSPSTARKFMQVAAKFKSVQCTDLNFATSALYLLARPSVSEKARDEALNRAKQGENISLPSAKEIVARHKSNADQPLAITASDSVSPRQAKAKKTAEMLDSSAPQKHKETMTPLATTTNQYDEAEAEQRADHAIIDVPAVTISDEPIGESKPQLFKVGDRIRIIRRQHGADDWTGSTATIWEVTTDGWLRVNVEGRDGVKFTLRQDWVELIQETTMTASNQTEAETIEPLEHQLHVCIPLEIEGKTVQVTGVINEVEVQYTYEGRTGTIKVPANKVVFPKNG